MPVAPGRYRVNAWNTIRGEPAGSEERDATGDTLRFASPALAGDRAFAIRRLSGR